MRIIMLGPQGSGKGTQAERLAAATGGHHISTGDLVRAEIRAGTPLGRSIKAYNDHGELVPDELIVALTTAALASETNWILDGFPRTLAQAEALERVLEQQGKRVDAAPFVEVSTDELLRRLGGRWVCRAKGHSFHMISNPPKVSGICDFDGSQLYQREDDSIDVARKRLEVYFNETQPVIDYYRRKCALVEINGEQSIEAVFDDLIQALQDHSPETPAAA